MQLELSIPIKLTLTHTSTMLLAYLLTLAWAACVSALSAGKQFNLTPMNDGSGTCPPLHRCKAQALTTGCFLECHRQAVKRFDLKGRNTNAALAIGLNCEEEIWRSRVSACLPTRCVSAPDTAYAVEYGKSFCKRAGVDVEFELPAWYLETPGGQYYK